MLGFLKYSLRVLGFVQIGFLFCACWATAAGIQDVSNTPHNLSVTAPDFTYASDEERVCIFCHTPHGGRLTQPLWNRTDSGVDPYNSYTTATMTSLGISSTRPISNESLGCLSCHDGSVSMYTVVNHNNSNPTITPSWSDKIVTGFDGPGAKIGDNRDATAVSNDLTDDHPISFNYLDVWGEYNANGKDDLHDPTNPPVSDSELKLYGSGLRIECSTCHDPHVDYINDTAYAPFLRMPNAQSGMCLTCHNK